MALSKAQLQQRSNANVGRLLSHEDSMFSRYVANDNKEYTYIANTKIYVNPLNQKYMRNITDEQINILKDGIVRSGLMHNLVVLDDMTGRYRLISGEKRFRAISRMTEEEYKKQFPNGIMTKIIKGANTLSQDDELRLLLECNVLAYSNEKPDPVQVRDLIAIYIKQGYERDDIISYLQKQIQYDVHTLEKVYSEADAIDELRKLQEEGKFTVAAMRRLCQGKKNEELQKLMYKTIIEDYNDVAVIDETLAGEIKKACKKQLAGQSTDSPSYTSIRKQIDGNLKKGCANIQKAKLKGLADVEAELLIKELEDRQRDIEACILRIRNRNEKVAAK